MRGPRRRATKDRRTVCERSTEAAATRVSEQRPMAGGSEEARTRRRRRRIREGHDQTANEEACEVKPAESQTLPRCHRMEGEEEAVPHRCRCSGRQQEQHRQYAGCGPEQCRSPVQLALHADLRCWNRREAGSMMAAPSPANALEESTLPQDCWVQAEAVRLSATLQMRTQQRRVARRPARSRQQTAAQRTRARRVEPVADWPLVRCCYCCCYYSRWGSDADEQGGG